MECIVLFSCASSNIRNDMEATNGITLDEAIEQSAIEIVERLRAGT